MLKGNFFSSTAFKQEKKKRVRARERRAGKEKLHFQFMEFSGV